MIDDSKTKHIKQTWKLEEINERIKDEFDSKEELLNYVEARDQQEEEYRVRVETIYVANKKPAITRFDLMFMGDTWQWYADEREF